MREWRLSDRETQHEINALEDAVGRFLDGRLPIEEFRPLRTLFGLYGQRQKDRYMLRVRVPEGILDAEELSVLAQAAREYSRGFAYVTTRQDIQVHFLRLESVPALLRMLAGAGLTTREAGGNVVRNITCDPYSGVCRSAVFDVTPHSHAIARQFLRNPHSQLLPRKVKIAFSGCPHDHSLTWVHDIGAQAVVRNGRRGFRIVIGGGLGIVPRIAQTLEEFVPEEELVPAFEAIIRVFHRIGPRADRKKARLKFVIDRVGVAPFRELVRKELAAMPPAGDHVYAQIPRELDEQPPPRHPKGADGRAAGFAQWSTVNAVRQAQEGYCTVRIALPVGTITADQFDALADLCVRFGNGTARATIEQNLLMRWVREDDLPALHAELLAAGLGAPIAGTVLDPVACPGAETCSSAITNAKGLARAVIRELGTNGLLRDPLTRGVHIRASGCPNSCGHHLVGDIGLYGCALHSEGRMLPAYHLLLRTTKGRGFGVPVVRLPAKVTPRAVHALLDYFRETHMPDEALSDFTARLGAPAIRAILEEYARIPVFTENPDAFVDWGQQRIFSLDERGEGECAV